MSNSALAGVSTMNDTHKTNNAKLQDFVTTIAALGRITFGDVRRLERDYLPGGITTCDEVELLIRLDGVVSRADRAWTGWLVTAIHDFAAGCDIDSAAGESRERLKALLAGPSSKTARRIGREIDRPVERPAEPVRYAPAPLPIPFPVKRDNAPPVRSADVLPRTVLTVVTWSSMNRLAMAA
jgi:hypothetical protein